jgi:uncharacterized protein (DUF1330 family)
MPAYVIVDVQVTDPVRYAEYIKQSPSSIARYGGRFLARGGRAEKLEGVWDPHRFVVLEFESLARAKEWWGSDEYRGPKALRQATSTANMIVVEGI